MQWQTIFFIGKCKCSFLPHQIQRSIKAGHTVISFPSSAIFILCFFYEACRRRECCVNFHGGGGRRIVWREIQIGTFIPRKLHKKRPQTRKQAAGGKQEASQSIKRKFKLRQLIYSLSSPDVVRITQRILYARQIGGNLHLQLLDLVFKQVSGLGIVDAAILCPCLPMNLLYQKQNIYGLFLDFLLGFCISPNFSALCVRIRFIEAGLLLSSSGKVFCSTAWLNKSRSITPRRGLDQITGRGVLCEREQGKRWSSVNIPSLALLSLLSIAFWVMKFTFQ